MANKEYEGWSNERLDDICQGKTYYRVGDVDRWNDKVHMPCNEGGQDFYSTPANIMYGQGCPVCRRIKQVGSRRKPKWTTPEVRQRVFECGFIMLDEKYKNCSSYLNLRCMKCGTEQQKQFRQLLTGKYSCKGCGNK
jgi:hypothetical protein